MKFEGETLTYLKGLRRVSVRAADLVWCYLQLEDASAQMCCGSYNAVIARVVAYSSDGTRHALMFEQRDRAEKLIGDLCSANPKLAVGYTAENRARFASFCAGA